ncbi:hypothetical protein PtB15_17B40 [Puccinia triticina]|nr:hypothetical protein PtB15_17B40 [Puccinia triticina]
METLAINVSQIPGNNKNLLAALERCIPDPVPQERHAADTALDNDNGDYDDTFDENNYFNDVDELQKN